MQTEPKNDTTMYAKGYHYVVTLDNPAIDPLYVKSIADIAILMRDVYPLCRFTSRKVDPGK